MRMSLVCADWSMQLSGENWRRKACILTRIDVQLNEPPLASYGVIKYRVIFYKAQGISTQLEPRKKSCASLHAHTHFFQYENIKSRRWSDE
jgi:hypothetical protein